MKIRLLLYFHCLLLFLPVSGGAEEFGTFDPSSVQQLSELKLPPLAVRFLRAIPVAAHPKQQLGSSIDSGAESDCLAAGCETAVDRFLGEQTNLLRVEYKRYKPSSGISVIANGPMNDPNFVNLSPENRSSVTTLSSTDVPAKSTYERKGGKYYIFKDSAMNQELNDYFSGNVGRLYRKQLAVPDDVAEFGGFFIVTARQSVSKLFFVVQDQEPGAYDIQKVSFQMPAIELDLEANFVASVGTLSGQIQNARSVSYRVSDLVNPGATFRIPQKSVRPLKEKGSTFELDLEYSVVGKDPQFILSAESLVGQQVTQVYQPKKLVINPSVAFTKPKLTPKMALVSTRGECGLQEEDIFDDCDVEFMWVEWQFKGEGITSVNVSCKGASKVDVNDLVSVLPNLQGAPFDGLKLRLSWTGETDPKMFECKITSHGTDGVTIIERTLIKWCATDDYADYNHAWEKFQCGDKDWIVYDLNGNFLREYDD